MLHNINNVVSFFPSWLYCLIRDVLVNCSSLTDLLPEVYTFLPLDFPFEALYRFALIYLRSRLMASERQIFGLSGPLHLTSIDWRDPNHRRSIAASLVQGVYILERDRQEKREGLDALAPPWWEFFNFQLIHVLVDPNDLSVFGSIYETKIPYSYHTQNPPPKYVIAFRGTITKSDTRSQDLKLDLQFIRNNLHQSTRFQLGLRAAHDLIAKAGAGSIWLAGHSLGSAIALMIGREMVKAGLHLDSFLFNPPFASLPIEKIKNEKIKHGFRVVNSYITAGVAAAVAKKNSDRKADRDESFAVLASWMPYLFVNQFDPICSEYIGYFEHREKIMAIGSGSIGRLATQNSIASILSSSKGIPIEAFHLIPSAILTTNRIPSLDFKQAHGIHQWWRSDIQLEHKVHRFT